MGMFLSIISLLLSAVWWGCCAETFKGSVGGSVDIMCDYSKGSEVETVFLKKNSSSEEVIESSKDRETKGRYSLHHDSANRYFTVTIRNLSSEDDGAYRCGAAGYDMDDYYIKTVHLKVEQTSSTPPLTTSNTSTHSTPRFLGVGTTSTHSTPRFLGVGTTSVHSTPTGPAASGSRGAVYGALAAAVLVVGLLVLTIILVKNRAKRKDESESAQRYQSNAEEDDGVYSEIQDTDGGANKLQTLPASTNQQASSPLLSIYTTANRPSDVPVANENSEISDFYSLATNPVPPTEVQEANQICNIDDTYSVAANPVDMPANQNPKSL